MINFQYVKASGVAAAIDAIAKDPHAAFIAGGTNLIDLMKKGVTTPEKLVDINALPLNKIEWQNKLVRIGALALNSDVADNEMIQQQLPLLSMALEAGASPQLRNMATVGGNMMQRTRCSYFYDTAMPCNKRVPGSGCGALKGYNRMHAIFGASDQCIAVHPSDMCVALTALDATVLVQSGKGTKKIPFGDFHRLPGNNPSQDNILQKGEMITAVEIPENHLQQYSYYLKVRDRASYAFALVSVAAAMDISNETIKDVRLAMGGVAHKPWRLVKAERFLAGRKVSAANFEASARLAMQDAKAYRHNAFKLKLAPNAIAEALKKAAGLS